MHSFTNYVVRSSALGENWFTVVDVGASGGFDRKWFVFGKYLRGFGFDMLENEVREMNERIDSQLGITFHAACVGTDEPVLTSEAPTNWVDSKRLAINPDQAKMSTVFSTSKPELTKLRLSLDEFFKSVPGSLDFIKIDTDGSDFNVIRSSSRILDDNSVLGLDVECQFHGGFGKKSEVFANIDNFLRSRGFSMFDMELVRTSRCALPGKAKSYEISNSDRGQIIWANVQYFRDLANPDYTQYWQFSITPLAILKLACLFELHKLNDCAAELILYHKEMLKDVLDIRHALNLLTKDYYGELESYNMHINLFNNDRSYFIPKIKSLFEHYGITYAEFVDLMEELRNMRIRLDKYDFSGKTIVFYGAGGRFQSLYPGIKRRLEVANTVFACDSNPALHGKEVAGIIVVAPEQLVQIVPDMILVTSVFYPEIVLGLKMRAKKHNTHFEIAILD